MLTLRRTTPGIRQISNSLSLEIKFLSSTSRNVTASTTSDGVAPRRLKIYETEKVVKYVHVSQPNPIQKLTGNTDPKEGNTNYIANPVGRFYQQAVHKGRQGNKIGLAEVKKMFMICEKPEDIKYAIGLVALLQKKGDDFSEETNKEFVKVCLKFERTDVLITEFSKFKLRMGAWTTPATLEMIVAALEAKDEVALGLPLFHTLALKCIVMSRSSVEAFIKSAANLGDKKEYEKVLQSALRVGPAEFINDLKVKYPLQDPPVVEEAAVEGSEAATSAE